MKKITRFIVAGFFFLICTNSFAATRANTTTFALGAGYEFFASKRNIQNATLPLALLGYNFTERCGIEALLGVINTTSHQSDTYGEHVHGGIVLVDGIYHFSSYRAIEPFVLAGVGVTGLDPNGTDARNEGNINAGAGLQWFVSDKVSLRVEARDLYTLVGGKNDVLLDGMVVFTF